jgi:hypothetical protein
MTTRQITRRTQRSQKTQKINHARANYIHWIVIGLIFFVGANVFTDQVRISRLQTEPLILDVPVLQQSLGTSCGEAVIAMVYNYGYPTTPISEAQVIDYASAQGYFTEGIPPYTSPVNMVKIARNYATTVSSGVVSTSTQGLALLMKHLRRGDPVVIDVLSNFSDPESEAHFIVITGITLDTQRGNAVVIHYNDPLTGTRESGDWLGATGVWNAWKNNGDPGGPGWWLVISPP